MNSLRNPIIWYKHGGNAIQEIYESLATIPSQVLEQTVTCPTKCMNIHQCLNLMNLVNLDDVGFTVQDLDHVDESFKANIATNNNFQIDLILIPKGASLPLHDHPDSTVLSKVIKGTVNVKSYSLLKSDYKEGILKNGALAARQEMNTLKTDLDSSWYLSPTDGNVHQVIAETPCVILDCTIKPYTTKRSSSCYSVETDSEQKSWLRLSSGNLVNLPQNIEYGGIRPIMKRVDIMNEARTKRLSRQE